MTADNKRERARLYLITPPRIENVGDFVDHFKAAIEGGDISALQVRIKPDGVLDTAMTRKVAQAVQALCQVNHIALIINDSPQLCRALNADGVHLGMGDMEISQAREIVGEDAIIGATCKNSRHHAMEAGEAGADYVAFGAFYPTDTKAETTPADPDVLTWSQMFLTLPCVAIGGITTETASALVYAG
ncbi:MAG: thiamine phosphate synthase [Pseudomonadota bacterium]